MVVVHTPRSTDAATLAALDAADAVLLVTTLDLFSLYGGKRALQRMARPGTAAGARRREQGGAGEHPR